MDDPCFALLLPFLRQPVAPTLWLADENLLHSAAQLQPHANLSVLSNRYDVFQQCRERGFDAHFSDYDCSLWPEGHFRQVVYRVSKEKPVVHHLINQARRLLAPAGQLILAGAKGDGIKSCVDKAGRLLGRKAPARKRGTAYLAVLPRAGDSDTPPAPLDDRDYPRLRPIAELNGRPLLSKPGVFGWDKIDAGSRLLMDCADQLRQQDAGFRPASCLDLGCGYGYLSLRTAAWEGLSERAASDNNAAAVACCRHNAAAFGLAVEVSADDCAAAMQRRFELVLCNPPFHQGFAVDSELTRKFLASARRCLTADGVALFVVNQFIPLETLAREHFQRIELHARDGGFKVLALHPR